MSDFEPVVPYLADFSPVEPLGGFTPQPVTPPIEVARLDGATKYWQLSAPITAPASTDFTYSAYISGTRTSDIEGIFSDSGGSSWLRVLDTDQSQDLQMFIGGSFKGASYPVGYDLRDGNFNLFKLSRVGGQLSFSINDSEMKSLGTSNAEFNIDNLFRFSNQYFTGVIYGFDVEIDGVLTNSIPLTNKAQGATQLATVGNVNATMLNYTGDEWEVRP